PTPAPAPATTAAAGDAYVYYVQAGAFTRPEEAETQKAKLAIQGFTAKVMEREQNGRTVYRVRLGPMDTRDAADDLQRKIEGAGFEANLVRVQR
ncbi:SPOR domain-containing protein, partial [Roseateles sp.]